MKTSRNVLLFLFLCIPVIALAQKKVLQIHLVQLPGRFPGSGVRLITQDKAGFLWYVTADGLYRYDGNELLHFGLNTNPALPSLPVTALCPDNKGNLWLGFANGAACFNLKRWALTPLSSRDWSRYHPKDRDIKSIACLHGKVYIGTESGKLYVVRHDSLHLVLDMTAHRKNGKFMTVADIQEPVPGQLWLSTSTGMLVYLPVTGNIYGAPVYYKFAEIKGDGISNICYDSSGGCLFATDFQNLFLTNIDTLYTHRAGASRDPYGPPCKGFVTKVLPPEGASFVWHSPFYLAQKRVAVLTGEKDQLTNISVFNFSDHTWSLATRAFRVPFPREAINTIAGQPFGAYVCSLTGLARLEFKKSPVRSLLNGFEHENSVRSVYEDSGYLYVSSYRDHFFRYNPSTGNTRSLLPGMNIYSQLPWGHDTLLLADEGLGLFWYILSKNKAVPIHIKQQLSEGSHRFISRWATITCRVNDSLILEGTYQGIHLVNPLKGKSYPIFTDSLASLMQSVKTDAIIPAHPVDAYRRTRYLVATMAGAFQVNTRKGRVRCLFNNNVPDKIRHAAAFALLDQKEQTWIGTNGLGVQASDSSGNIISMKWLNDRLNGQVVYSLVRSGPYILIGTNNGLNAFNTQDSSVSSYTVYSGLPSNEFNQAAVFNSGKYTYMGTTNGLVRWDNRGAEMEKVPSSIHFHLNKLIIADQRNKRKTLYRYPYLPRDSQKIIIPSNAIYFSVYFGDPELNGRQLTYYYRLHPGDPWIELGDHREITFIKAPPGNGRLQFAARSPGGLWMKDTFGFPLVVQPAFYQTLWFKVLLVLLVTGLVGLVFRYREVQMAKERDVRMKIAGDLHDEVGGSLTRIWHQAQAFSSYHHVVNGNEISPGKRAQQKDRMRTIARTSQEALSMMSDMVWSIDARFDSLEELILRMKDYVYKLQDELEVSLDFKVMGEYKSKKLSQVVRQNLFLLFKEAITNAIRHGDASSIVIRMTLQDKQLKLQIINSFYPCKASKQVVIQGGKGIKNMQRRANKMSGQLNTEYADGKYVLTVVI